MLLTVRKMLNEIIFHLYIDFNYMICTTVLCIVYRFSLLRNANCCGQNLKEYCNNSKKREEWNV